MKYIKFLLLVLLFPVTFLTANPFDYEISLRQKSITAVSNEIKILQDEYAKIDEKASALRSQKINIQRNIRIEKDKIARNKKQIEVFLGKIDHNNKEMMVLVQDIAKLNSQISSYNDFFGIDDLDLRLERKKYESKLQQYEEKRRQIEDRIASSLQASANERLLDELIGEKQKEIAMLDKSLNAVNEELALKKRELNEKKQYHQILETNLQRYIDDYKRKISEKAKAEELRRKELAKKAEQERLKKEREERIAREKREKEQSASQSSSPNAVARLLKRYKIRPLVAKNIYNPPVKGSIINRSIGVNFAVRYSVKAKTPVYAISDGILYYRSSDDLGTRGRVLGIAHDSKNISVYQDLSLDDNLTFKNHQMIKKGQLIGYTKSNQMNFYIFRLDGKQIAAHKFLKK